MLPSQSHPPCRQSKKTLPSPFLKRPEKKLSLSEYRKHGVVQYMRPDGDEDIIPKYIGKQGEKSCNLSEETLSMSSVQKLNEELKLISESNFPDRATRAGRALKDIKRRSVQPNSRHARSVHRPHSHRTICSLLGSIQNDTTKKSTPPLLVIGRR